MDPQAEAAKVRNTVLYSKRKQSSGPNDRPDVKLLFLQSLVWLSQMLPGTESYFNLGSLLFIFSSCFSVNGSFKSVKNRG